jgi:hypothetical protein
MKFLVIVFSFKNVKLYRIFIQLTLINKNMDITNIISKNEKLKNWLVNNKLFYTRITSLKVLNVFLIAVIKQNNRVGSIK